MNLIKALRCTTSDETVYMLMILDQIAKADDEASVELFDRDSVERILFAGFLNGPFEHFKALVDSLEPSTDLHMQALRSRLLNAYQRLPRAA